MTGEMAPISKDEIHEQKFKEFEMVQEHYTNLQDKLTEKWESSNEKIYLPSKRKKKKIIIRQQMKGLLPPVKSKSSTFGIVILLPIDWPYEYDSARKSVILCGFCNINSLAGIKFHVVYPTFLNWQNQDTATSPTLSNKIRSWKDLFNLFEYRIRMNSLQE